jgi:hypothetical protein
VKRGVWIPISIHGESTICAFKRIGNFEQNGLRVVPIFFGEIFKIHIPVEYFIPFLLNLCPDTWKMVCPE